MVDASFRAMRATIYAVLLAACEVGGPVVVPDASTEKLPRLDVVPSDTACGERAVWMPAATLTLSRGHGPVAVALDGDRAVLGFGGNAKHGQVGVFRRDKGTWVADGSLTVPWPGSSESPLAISDDLVAVGAPSCTPSDDSHPGAVDLFARRDTGWSRVATLRAREPAKGDCFGDALALQHGRLVVGSALATYVYDCTAETCVPAGELSEPATAVAVDDDRLAVGTRGTWWGDRARVRIYEDGGADWRVVTTFEAGDPADHGFGHAIAFGTDTLIVGAPAMVEAMRSTPGAVYVFDDRPAGWVQRARLVADTGVLGDAVAIDGDRIVTTAHSATYVFRRWFGTWQEEDRWESPPASPSDSVAISGDTILVGHRAASGDAEGRLYRCVAPPIL